MTNGAQRVPCFRVLDRSDLSESHGQVDRILENYYYSAFNLEEFSWIILSNI